MTKQRVSSLNALGKRLRFTAVVIALSSSVVSTITHAQTDTDFVNWESAHVNPLALTPDNTTLLVVNTADATLEVFEFVDDLPVLRDSIPVGLDPVSVRARSNTEAWVVNHVSDSISIVDLSSGTVTYTLQTEDEPADVVFAGDDNRAFVTASQANMVQVFDPSNLAAEPTNVQILGEDPRTLAVSPDGNTVYAAIFESGNASTIIRGGRDYGILPRNGFGEYRGVDDVSSPYAGQNPPPNNGDSFSPAINPTVAGNIPRVSMIVKKGATGLWLDDNNVDWSEMITGEEMEGFTYNASGRVPGWDMPDNDVAIIDANSLALSYQSGLMNIVMGLAVNPASGRVTTVGTEAHNEVRFEPNLRSHFITVTYADFIPNAANRIINLNPHITPEVEFLEPSVRAQSIGDPRHITWDASGATAYITGMGSNNIVRVDNNGTRTTTIEVGQGPTASIIRSGNVIVLNRFDASLSVINEEDSSEVANVAFFDPTPESINIGRVQFYNTHETSGMGQISCASCHIDGKHDRLVWDLGNPAGEYTYRNGIEFHPMKGPLRTTSLVGVVGSPSLHFRGDKDDIAGFNGTFTALQGLNEPRTDAQMAELETFIASMFTPPNPFRNLDNTMPDAVVIPGPELRIGNPNAGNTAATCNRCHIVELNGRSDVRGQVAGFNSPGQQPTIAPSLRSMYEILGFTYDFADQSTAGFGFIGDGVMDAQTQNTLSNDDRLAFMMAYNGDLLGDTHAGVGTQLTLNGTTSDDDLTLLQALVDLAEAEAIGLIAHGQVGTDNSGFTYLAATGGEFQTARAAATINYGDLLAASTTNPVTFTAVPKGSEIRMGVDRDNNGIYDNDEGVETPVEGTIVVPARIQAEAFVNYFDSTPGQQRRRAVAGFANENVDIQTNTDNDGTPVVGWITAGEWLEYTIFSETDQTIDIFLRTASPLNGQFVTVLLNDEVVGTIDIPNTGRYRNFTNTNPLVNLALAANTNYVLRLEFTTGGLDLNYIEVLTSGERLFNVALDKPTTQSTTDFSGVSARAVDGNTNGLWANGSITHTQRRGTAQPWWRVDLGAEYAIEEIKVFNRTNGTLGNRLVGAKVYVGNIDSTDPADYTELTTLGSGAEQVLSELAISGRYVLIRHEGDNETLSLAEVQIFTREP